MVLFVLVISLFVLCQSQPFSLSPNKYVSYYQSSSCPRTSSCLQLSSAAQLLGPYSWPKYVWNGNFTLSFWYYPQTNSIRNASTTHNIISNCHSNGVASGITSFLLATETVSGATKTSYFDVYFNNSQQCASIHANTAQCSSQHVMINNVWQYITIIYKQKTGFYVYSNNTLWNNITWGDSKQNRNPIQSNNVLCIGDGDNTNNGGFMQLLSDIRFYNKSISKQTMKHLFDLNYNLSHADNNGVFVYYDFLNNTTTNNMKHLCLQLFYIHAISPQAISLNGGDTIHLYGNFGDDVSSDNVVIVVYDKYDSKFVLNIASSSIINVASNQISFNIAQSASLNNICSDKIYINITSKVHNCFINNKSVSISTYSPNIRVLPDQLPAINYFNITIQSQCIPPHDDKLHCHLYLNNINRDIPAKILSTSEIICKFTDLSSLLPSTNYNLQIYSVTYNYTTVSNKISIYNAPSIKELSATSFTDNDEAAVLLVYGSNFIYSQPFYCNFLDSKDPNKLMYHSKGEITANGAYVSCLIATNLIPPSRNYQFYLSSETYFNSSKIPFLINNSAPYLINSIFIFKDSNNNIYPASSLQYFYTQIVDKAYNNFTYSPKGYKYAMFSADCVSMQFVMNDMGNGILNWSYIAPMAFNQNNISCDINFTAFDIDQDKITSFILFNLQFQTFKPMINSINNTLLLINNITDFGFTLSNLYIDHYQYYYYKHNSSLTYILSNNMSIKCVFTNAKDANLKFESFAILVSDDKYTNIQSMRCPQVIIPETGQYIFQFKMIQFKQTYLTDAYNAANGVIFAYNLPTFGAINFNSSKHIYLYGDNLFIGANALHINAWDVRCNFGNDIVASAGNVINDTVIFCSMPVIDRHSLHNVVPITITYYKYIDDDHNVYNTFAPLLFLTNLSLSFTSKCPGDCNGNGYCDYDAVCHCNVGYSADDCHLPLYFIILSAIVIFFISIIILLIYCCRTYQRKYHKLKVKYQEKQLKNMQRTGKYYGYKPISDNENYCCCFNLTPNHFGYYVFCQFCCFCEERIIRIKLDDDHESITYTSTFHAKLSAQYQQQHKFVNQKPNVYGVNNNNNNNVNNAESDSETEQCELSVEHDQRLSVSHQYQ